MPLLPLLLFALLGMAVVVALSAALYAALPHYFLECAERHGRFRGLGALADEATTPRGTPTEIAAEGKLHGQPA